MNKETFKFNKNGLKNSCDQYRNIKGIHYICYSSNPSDFDDIKNEMQEKDIKTKIIKGELYVEKK